MEWWQDVKIALEELGGQAHLSQIYPIVYGRRNKRKDTLGNYEAWIRNSLQENSRGKGHDVFVPARLGSGVWKLKSGAN